MDDLNVVVGKTDGGESRGREHGNPDKRIAQVGPEQRGNQDGDGNQQAAHGGRAGLFLMSLRAFFADVLPDLKITQPLNHDRTDDQAGEKRSKTGEGGAKR